MNCNLILFFKSLDYSNNATVLTVMLLRGWTLNSPLIISLRTADPIKHIPNATDLNIF